jgi:cell wall-associated NlpC family hydrolase
MKYGICKLSAVPARREPSGTSEMVTQLLFGEHYTVMQSLDGWLKIKIAADNYECWISDRQHTRISEATFNQLQKHPAFYANELIHVLFDKTTGTSVPLTIGATLPLYNKKVISFESFNYTFDGTIASSADKKTADAIISTAFLFLNAPYLWGGKTPFGIDCSGFTQLTFKLNGYYLPRDSQQQVEQGEPLNFVEEALPGDLAFFDNDDGKIVHVGILLNKEKIIHSSGYVRVDKFDHYGIYDPDKKGYSHTLRVIKRIVE